MSYIDGFVIAVPTANRDAYLNMARQAAAVLRADGATFGSVDVMLRA